MLQSHLPAHAELIYDDMAIPLPTIKPKHNHSSLRSISTFDPCHQEVRTQRTSAPRRPKVPSPRPMQHSRDFYVPRRPAPAPPRPVSNVLCSTETAARPTAPVSSSNSVSTGSQRRSPFSSHHQRKLAISLSSPRNPVTMIQPTNTTLETLSSKRYQPPSKQSGALPSPLRLSYSPTDLEPDFGLEISPPLDCPTLVPDSPTSEESSSSSSLGSHPLYSIIEEDLTPTSCPKAEDLVTITAIESEFEHDDHLETIEEEAEAQTQHQARARESSIQAWMRCCDIMVTHDGDDACSTQSTLMSRFMRRWQDYEGDSSCFWDTA